MSGAKKKLERRADLAQMGMTEREKKELKDKQTQRRNGILAAVGGVVAVVLVVALLVWHSGVIPRNTTALTVKDHTFTVADMDYYYHQALNAMYSNQQYLVQMYEQNGMEYTEPLLDPNGDLKTQYVDADKTQSYYDYFKEQAKANATEVAALYDAAKANGHTLTEETQTSLDNAQKDLDTQIQQYGFGSRSAYLKALYGRNMTEKVYMRNIEMNLWASDYYNSATASMENYSDEDLRAYYDANPAKLDSYDYDYVYFGGDAQPTTDADGNQVDPTEEAKAAALEEAKKKADAMLAAVQAAQNETPAEGTQPKDFSAVATEQGVTATVRTDSMGSSFATMPFDEWLMDPERKDGDTDLFELDGLGYYVVQYHGRSLYDEPTVDVRHILLSTAMDDDPDTADVDESKTPTDQHVSEVQAQAQALLDQFNAGEKTAEAFGELAEEHSEDGRNEDGSLYTPGGLYEGVKKGQMVKPFEDWCFDASRAEGDTGLVQTDYGWHVMYFQASHRPAWMDEAENAKSTADKEAFTTGVEEGYEAVEGSGWSNVGLS